jgi:hypothetical protein
VSAEVHEPRITSGLATLWNVIVAPAAAFAALRERPTWVAAFVVTALATALAQFLMLPASLHAVAASYPAQLASDPRLANLTPEQKQQALTFALATVRFAWPLSAVYGILAALSTALVLVRASALGRGTVNFARMFALAMNVAVINFGIAQFLIAAIVVARGPEAFAAPQDLYLAVPSAAWFAASAGPKVAALLSVINPFSLWSLVLLGSGTATLAAIKPAYAYAAAILLILCSGLFLSLAVR